MTKMLDAINAANTVIPRVCFDTRPYVVRCTVKNVTLGWKDVSACFATESEAMSVWNMVGPKSMIKASVDKYDADAYREYQRTGEYSSKVCKTIASRKAGTRSSARTSGH